MARYKLRKQGDYKFYKEGITYDENFKEKNAALSVRECVWNSPQYWELIREDDMEELKISKEKVLEAANTCSTAKEVMKVLFPEVFKDKEAFTAEGLDQLKTIIQMHKFVPYEIYTKIPGRGLEEKANSISDLIYRTWCK